MGLVLAAASAPRCFFPFLMNREPLGGGEFCFCFLFLLIEHQTYLESAERRKKGWRAFQVSGLTTPKPSSGARDGARAFNHWVTPTASHENVSIWLLTRMFLSTSHYTATKTRKWMHKNCYLGILRPNLLSPTVILMTYKTKSALQCHISIYLPDYTFLKPL